MRHILLWLSCSTSVVALIGLVTSNVAATTAAVDSPCKTAAIYHSGQEPTWQEVVCIDSCGVYGCDKFRQSLPTYGVGWTCGCPGGGPWVCCHTVASENPEVEPWVVATGNCDVECGSGGTCTIVVTEIDPETTEFTAECIQ
jgi:hypothetical protein